MFARPGVSGAALRRGDFKAFVFVEREVYFNLAVKHVHPARGELNAFVEGLSAFIEAIVGAVIDSPEFLRDGSDVRRARVGRNFFRPDGDVAPALEKRAVFEQRHVCGRKRD